ncbi:MAG: hypothetical protein M5U31_04430 [Acidimicrobiia bacterium]|nr:hypothetical protein [Acidimicrobiia bacterium]
MGPTGAFEIALDAVHERGELTDLTLATVEGLWRGLKGRAERVGARSLAEINDEFVADFVSARNRDGSVPSTATKHLRRWAVRFFYQMLRESGVQATDPTDGLALPPRPSSETRPLTDEEVALCRAVVEYPANATLKAAAWALAEASASTSEIPAVRRRDVDPACARVQLPGARLVAARSVPLTDFAGEQIERRLSDIAHDPETLIAYTGSGARPQSAAAMVLGKVLRRAGLADEPGVRPASIRAWVGVRILHETDSIEAVARRLGLRSLDSAARVIGLEWRDA